MNTEQEVYKYLDSLNIEYKVYEHEAIFSMDESNKLKIGFNGPTPKNILLKHKSGLFILVVIKGSKKIDINKIATEFNISKRLRFASSDELFEQLKIKTGSVSPFNIINSKSKLINLVIDNDLLKSHTLSFHPNTNTKTIDISTKDFKKIY